MESNVNNNRLPLNKRKIFKDNECIGTHDGIIDANIIAFEHVLEKIQNKLSLPEYDGPENFEETDEDQYNIEKSMKTFDSTSTVFNSQNSIMSGIGKKQISLTSIYKKKRRPTFSQNIITKPIKSKIGTNKPGFSLKQMTLDKYSFHDNLIKSSPKTSCSIMIACSTSTSIDNKSYTHEKVLFWKNPSILPNLDKLCELPIKKANSDEVSCWNRKKSIVPTILGSISSPEENNLESQPLLCLMEQSSVKDEEADIKHQISGWIKDDSLDMDIEAAMKKYDTAIENSGETANMYIESGIQTTPPYVHACNCLGYHKCELFKGLVDGKCIKKRDIDALDLDTLHYTSGYRYSAIDAIQNKVSVQHDPIPTAPNFSNDQEVPFRVDTDHLSERHKSQTCITLNEPSKTPNQGEFSTETLQQKKDLLKENSTDQQRFQFSVDSKIVGEACDDQLKDCLKQTCKNIPAEFSCNSHYRDDLYPPQNKLSKLEMFLPQENEQEVCAEKLDIAEMSEKHPPLQMKYSKGFMNEQQNEKVIPDNSITDGFEKQKYIHKQKIIPGKDLDDFTVGNKNIIHSDQDVPDITVELCESNELDIEETIISDGCPWNSSFQWGATSSYSESTVKKPFEEFLNLKSMPQKVRRIGLSRRAKPVKNLHPIKRQNL